MAKKKVAIFTTVQGHESITEALQDALNLTYETAVFFDRNILFDAYLLMYKHAPGIFGKPFTATTNHHFTLLAHNFFKRHYLSRLTEFVETQRPDALINTFWMYEDALETLSKKTGLPLLNYVPDPRTAHPVELATPPFLNLIFDSQALLNYQRFLPDINCVEVGWCVRAGFETTYNQKKVKSQLDLPTDHLNILFVAGSEGTENIMQILESLHTALPVTVTVACGRNRALVEKIITLNQTVKAFSPELELIPVSFTPEIYRYMQAADLIVGKAGPNMLFEAIATKTPFMATTHIAGQEDGNLDIIREYQVGWVEENPERACVLLESIIAKPQKLSEFLPGVQKLAIKNHQAKKIIRQLVDQALR